MGWGDYEAKQVSPALKTPIFVTNGAWVFEVEKTRVTQVPLQMFDGSQMAEYMEHSLDAAVLVKAPEYWIQTPVTCQVQRDIEGGGTMITVPHHAILHQGKTAAPDTLKVDVRWRAEIVDSALAYERGPGETLCVFDVVWDRVGRTLFLYGPEPTDDQRAAAAELWFDKVTE